LFLDLNFSTKFFILKQLNQSFKLPSTFSIHVISFTLFFTRFYFYKFLIIIIDKGKKRRKSDRKEKKPSF